MISKFKWIVLPCAAALFAAAMAPWTFSGTAMRNEVARQLRRTTGLIAETDGRAVFALLPRPRIKIENIRIHDPSGSLQIDADFLRGNLRILPMFAGRLEITSAALVAPRMRIDVDFDRASANGAISRAARLMNSGRPANNESQTERLGILSIVDGSATLTSKARQVSVDVEKINISFDWRRIESSAGLQGSFEFKGERAEVAAWLAKPIDLLDGKSTELSLRLSSTPLTLDMNGVLTNNPRFEYLGNLNAKTSSLRKLGAGLDYAIPLPGPLQAIAMSASARIQSASIALSDLKLSMDGNAYEGAMIFDGERLRPVLSGTLAASSLDLAPFFAGMPQLTDPDREWSRARIDLPALPPVDVDLRVSAARARAGRVQLNDAAFSMLVNEKEAQFTVAEVKAFNGAMKGRLSAQPGPNGYDFAANVALQNVDASALLTSFLRSSRLNGEMSGEFKIVSQGDTPMRILSSMNGRAQIALKSGDFSGLDLEQALRRLEKRPLSVASEVRTGRTNFATAAVDVQIENGTANISHGRASGAGVEFDVTGSATLPDRTLELRLEATQTGTDPAARESAPWLSMNVAGGWDDPVMTLDARSLINRSQAAAPLLRAPNNTASPVSETAPH